MNKVDHSMTQHISQLNIVSCHKEGHSKWTSLHMRLSLSRTSTRRALKAELWISHRLYGMFFLIDYCIIYNTWSKIIDGFKHRHRDIFYKNIYEFLAYSCSFVTRLRCLVYNCQFREFLPLSPSGWRGIVITVRAGGRAAAKLAEPISL